MPVQDTNPTLFRVVYNLCRAQVCFLNRVDGAGVEETNADVITVAIDTIGASVLANFAAISMDKDRVF